MYGLLPREQISDSTIAKDQTSPSMVNTDCVRPSSAVHLYLHTRHCSYLAEGFAVLLIRKTLREHGAKKARRDKLQIHVRGRVAHLVPNVGLVLPSIAVVHVACQPCNNIHVCNAG